MFDPLNFANLANVLGDDDTYDLHARTRTATGRVYYSLMLAVRAAIRKAENKSVDLEIEDHGKLWRTLQETDDSKLQALGKLLEDYYSARKQADYVLDSPNPRWDKWFSDPRLVRTEAEVAADTIENRIPKYDFGPVLGKL